MRRLRWLAFLLALGAPAARAEPGARGARVGVHAMAASIRQQRSAGRAKDLLVLGGNAEVLRAREALIQKLNGSRLRFRRNALHRLNPDALALRDFMDARLFGRDRGFVLSERDEPLSSP